MARSSRPLAAVGCALALIGAACSPDDDSLSTTTLIAPTTTVETAPAPEVLVTVRLIDEAGQPITKAAITLAGASLAQPMTSSTQLRVNQPVAAVISADGFLSEPVTLDPGTSTVEVMLWSRFDADGNQRVAVHFAGDMMMGRRYQVPEDRTDTPLVTTENQARGVVAEVGPLMAAADASVLNLETVVGTLPDDAAYPGKRFLLQTPPVALAALDEMGIDMVTLGNNHANDWQDAGVESTLAALDAARMPWVGAGRDRDEATAGGMVTVGVEPGDVERIGIVSATTVDGTFVNDNLPSADEAMPPDTPLDERWQYSDRVFGFGQPGDPAYIPTAPRRIGELWSLFVELEDTVDDQTIAEVWSAITAPDVAPELQDWVARRGHGGAARFESTRVAAEIAASRERGASTVVVQLHGGFQFADVPSEFLREVARGAIDAGADMVIAHHPHVLQGFEFYNGKLIAYSLGNFVFDQDFLSTFPSAILRVVLQGGELLEARAIPLTVDRYRPVPVTAGGAVRVLQLLDSRSAAAATSVRSDAGEIVSQFDESLLSGEFAASVDPLTGVISPGRPQQQLTVTLDDRGVAVVDCAAVLVGLIDGLEIGLELISEGGFDDVTADRTTNGAVHWSSSGSSAVVVGSAVDDQDRRYVQLQPGITSGTLTRPVSRSMTPLHRLVDAQLNGLDGTPEYTFEFDARIAEAQDTIMRLVTYQVNDSDPNVDPDSIQLATVDLPLRELASEWSAQVVDVTGVINTPVNGIRAEAVLPYFVASAGSSFIDVDNVHLYEWRTYPVSTVEQWVPVDVVRGQPGSRHNITVTGCTSAS